MRRIMLAFALAMSVALAANGVDQAEMERVYAEVATPVKRGMILKPRQGEMLDNPMVFRKDGEWRMMYIRFDGKGYETLLAKSKNLLDWEPMGKVLERGKNGEWDSAQADGMPVLLSTQWGGGNELKPFDGKYWMFYIGGARQGYETDPLESGIAWTQDPLLAVPWTKWKGNPVLSPKDGDAREFERVTIYKHFVVEDETRALGGRFVDFYNAKGPRGEHVGMAVSDDMLKWRRHGKNCCPIPDIRVADPMLQKIGDIWVMFYYSVDRQCKRAWDTFACSRDLVHWTKWNGQPLVEPSEPWDTPFAHKPWVIKHNGVVYHFYNAVGNSGRGLALATSSK